MEYQTIMEIMGYSASIIVALSLMMKSIVKLRWFNLAGALLMSVYGFFIRSLPVGFLNLFIALVDIYFLWQIYLIKEYYKLLLLPEDTEYLKYFLNFYKEDIKIFFPSFEYKKSEDTIRIFILRNTVPAGLLIGEKAENDTFEIDIEYAVPEHRDKEIGHYIYHKNEKFFKDRGFMRFKTKVSNKSFEQYVKSMGFILHDNGFYIKEISKKW